MLNRAFYAINMPMVADDRSQQYDLSRHNNSHITMRKPHMRKASFILYSLQSHGQYVVGFMAICKVMH